MNSINQLNPYILIPIGTIPVEQILGVGTNFSTLEEYNLSVFLNIFPEFKSVFDSSDTNNTLTRYNRMFQFYLNLGSQIFTDDYYGDNQTMAISLYIAHYLQLSIMRTKNVGNTANLNTQSPSATVARDLGGGKEVIITPKKALSDFQAEMSQTEYGMELYPIMRAVGNTRLRGVY